MFYTIEENSATAEITEKKSRFIANIFYVRSEEEAQDIIKLTKKKYYDAKHNCYAYRIITEGNLAVERQSDDGEPSGTAGAPMLNILTKSNLGNILVIVTRYFGGILLGTGGLVKAYTSATLKGLEATKIIQEILGIRVSVRIEYSNLEALKYYADKNGFKIVDTKFENDVTCEIELTEGQFNELLEAKNLDILEYNVLKSTNIRVVGK